MKKGDGNSQTGRELGILEASDSESCPLCVLVRITDFHIPQETYIKKNRKEKLFKKNLTIFSSWLQFKRTAKILVL